MKKKLLITIALFASLSTVSLIKANDAPMIKTSAAFEEEKYRTYYQLLVYSFADGNGDGIGDFKGIIDKLDYLENLGVSGLWLSPVNKASSYHSYDVEDYYKINPVYEVTVNGTKYDFDRLINECSQRGIGIIMDLVVNHSSKFHPWFIEGAEAFGKNQSSPYINYYNFSHSKSNKYNKQYSNNVYYEGLFSDWMPDFNLDNPATKDAFVDIGKYWLSKGVVGFRLDAAMHVFTKYSGGDVWSDYDIAKDNAWWSYFSNGIRQAYPQAFCVSENWTNDDDIAKLYGGNLDASFAFGFKGNAENLALRNGSGQNYIKYITDFQNKIRQNDADGIEAYFYGNHDIPRATFDNDLFKSKMAAQLQIMAPGNSFIFYGEELNLQGQGVSGDKIYRTPMAWKDQYKTNPNAYFGTSASSKILSGKTADDDVLDSNSLYNYYKDLVHLKESNSILSRGKLTRFNNVSDDKIAMHGLSYNNENFIVIHNVSQSPKSITLSGLTISDQGGALVSGTHIVTNDKVQLAGAGVVVVKIEVGGLNANQKIEISSNGIIIPGTVSSRVWMKPYDNNWLSSNNNAKVYIWKSSDGTKISEWPGETMELINGLYSFVIYGSGYDRIIFNNNQGSQTEDLTINLNSHQIPFYQLQGSSGTSISANVSSYNSNSPTIKEVMTLIESLTCDNASNLALARAKYDALADNEKKYLDTLSLGGDTYLARIEYHESRVIIVSSLTDLEFSKEINPYLLLLIFGIAIGSFIIVGWISIKRQHHQ